MQFPPSKIRLSRLNTEKKPLVRLGDAPRSLQEIERDALLLEADARLRLWRRGFIALACVMALAGVSIWHERAAHDNAATVENLSSSGSLRVSSPIHAVASQAVSTHPAAGGTQANATPQVPALAPASPHTPASARAIEGQARSAASAPVEQALPFMPKVPGLQGVQAAPAQAVAQQMPKSAVTPQEHLRIKVSAAAKVPTSERAHARHVGALKPAPRSEQEPAPVKKALVKRAPAKTRSEATRATSRRAHAVAEESPFEAPRRTQQARHGQTSSGAKILYQSAAAAVPSPAPSSAPARVASPHEAAPKKPAKPIGQTGFSVVSIPLPSLILVETQTSQGSLVRPIKVGQMLPDGEKLISADPAAGVVVTSARVIHLHKP